MIVICAVTGFLSHAAYNPGLDGNATQRAGDGFDLYFFDWPTSPAWIYAVNQGLHVITGIVAIPLLFAKLWSAIPKLFEWPPVRSPAHALERLSLALLVGGSLFVFFTGILNVQLWYPFGFGFLPAHYYGAFIFLAALTLHVAIKLPVVRRSFGERGVVRPLRDDLEHTRPEAYDHEADSTAPEAPAAPTLSRRGLIATIGAGSLGLFIVSAGQAIGGPLRRLAVLAPRGGDIGGGPNAFPVNKSAATAKVTPALAGANWQLQLEGPSRASLFRFQLADMEQHTEDLPIACVEGWSTTQTWTGVRLRDLAKIVGAENATELVVESLQPTGAFRKAAFARNQLDDERSLLALRVNGEDLSLDHGFPARIIIPGAPGVHNTKWVSSMKWTS
ncbi:MAG: molybdopterin-dependent oxidoreductase [Thermoleophilaceae bacterium]|nr:molybdopterin-dependent oxidoreductase [Thermoleophilaceae bacterium]